MSKAENQVVSIDDFDERADNDQGLEIELSRADGRKTGIHVTVVGEQSERVQAHVFRTINRRRRQDFVNARKGKNGEVTSIEDDVELTRNPSFVTQILEASADTAAFTKG